MPFNRNVFVNCPFDTEYRKLLRPLLFTVVYIGLEPQISETTDSGEQRVNNIQGLIQNSRYSIHDLSRIEVKKLPRFNMPFELGLDIGCKRFGNEEQRSKRCLILEKEQYRYQRVLSDISGNDIEAHKEDAQTLIRKVRNWFISQNIESIPALKSPNVIWTSFNEFESYLGETLRGDGFNQADIDEMPKSEFIRYVKDWVQGRTEAESATL